MDFCLGILLGETEPENATRLTKTASMCPYCTSFSCSSGTILGLYVIPRNHSWWLQWVKEKPQETLGLQKVEIFFARTNMASSPWSRGEVQAILELAPCGANCLDCTMYKGKCPGCPATRHFLEE